MSERSNGDNQGNNQERPVANVEEPGPSNDRAGEDVPVGGRIPHMLVRDRPWWHRRMNPIYNHPYFRGNNRFRFNGSRHGTFHGRFPRQAGADPSSIESANPRGRAANRHPRPEDRTRIVRGNIFTSGSNWNEESPSTSSATTSNLQQPAEPSWMQPGPSRVFRSSSQSPLHLSDIMTSDEDLLASMDSDSDRTVSTDEMDLTPPRRQVQSPWLVPTRPAYFRPAFGSLQYNSLNALARHVVRGGTRIDGLVFPRLPNRDPYPSLSDLESDESP